MFSVGKLKGVCPENASCYGVLLAASLEVNMCSKPNVTTEKIKDLRKALPIFFSIVLSVYCINNIMLEYYGIFSKLSKIHSKKCWVVLTQFWVKYGQTQNVGLKM